MRPDTAAWLTAVCAIAALFASAIAAYVSLKTSEQIAKLELKLILFGRQIYVTKEECQVTRNARGPCQSFTPAATTGD